jgi:hypothetical protein
MEAFLNEQHRPEADFAGAVNTALDAWSVGHLALGSDELKQIPDRDAIAKHRAEQLSTAGIEAAVLERAGKRTIRYRSLTDEQVRPAITS